jgi:carbamate kinase
MKKLLRIFALGGNEISPTGKVDPKTKKTITPDLPMQWQRSAKTCEKLATIIKNHPEDYFILSHGNGPQVGNILRRAELSVDHLYPLTLDVCGADTQGAIGYMLAQLSNSLRAIGVNKIAAETVTQVLVDKNDPAFNDPTKYIGSAMTKKEAKEKEVSDGWQVKMYKKNDLGEEIWRRVVPSPLPKDVIEIEIIESNLKAGIIPIAVGGGGIPVVKSTPRKEGDRYIYPGRFEGIDFVSEKEVDIYVGVEAVIDKDLASSFLGTSLLGRAKKRGEELSAEFTIFTDVDGAKLNYQSPDQVDLRKLTLEEAKKLYNEGAFPGGSMGPKIKACIDFIEGGGDKAYISTVDLFEETLKGQAGTTILRV